MSMWAYLLSCVRLVVTTWTVPSGSSVHGILQARILEWVVNALLQGIFLTQGLNLNLLHLLHWQAKFFTTGST